MAGGPGARGADASAQIGPLRYPDSCVLQFARAPVPGEAKTRLIPALGPRRAALVHRHMTRAVCAALARAQLCRHELWIDRPHPFFLRLGATLRQQQGAGLGERLAHAARESLRRRRCVLLIGSDCLQLDTAYLRGALDSLHAGCDAALGPAADGGYVLLGLRRFDESLFRDMPWGGPEVARITRQRLAALGWRVELLAERQDVDTPDALRLLPATLRRRLAQASGGT